MASSAGDNRPPLLPSWRAWYALVIVALAVEVAAMALLFDDRDDAPVKPLDWIVLAATLVAVVAYGALRSRHGTVESYLRGGRDLRWWTIGLSIMATQASAITFLSMPGQAYEDGLGFVQFYLGLPVAMVILSAFILPVYHRLKVYTAYEYLETRFDRKTRQLTALLFLLSRGLAAGLSIYAPSLILSAVLGWPVGVTNLVIGALTILYTVSGGTRAVARTQTWQMAIILAGMALALGFVIARLPPSVSVRDAVSIAGALGRATPIDFSLRLGQRYTFWSGLLGGLFVQLAYFGTDQSQVQRYLSGSPLTESRLGLMMNGLIKVPMQLFILFVGLMVFVFYQFQPPPLSFHQAELDRLAAGPHAAELVTLEVRHARAVDARRAAAQALLAAEHVSDGPAVQRARAGLREGQATVDAARRDARSLIARAHPGADGKDADYIFLRFVMEHFPSGLIGLLLAVIFCAAMSASASALNSLASTSVVDFYRRSFRPSESDAHYLRAARAFTVLWGGLAIGFAGFAALLDNLIQAVNILGSIFYGPMLGVFLVGLFGKRTGGTAVFVAALVGEAAVIATFALSAIGFLWYNVIGCVAVVALAPLLERLLPRSRTA